MEKAYDSYEILKVNYKDVFTEEDLLEAFEQDKKILDMKIFIKRSCIKYMILWVLILVILFLIIEYLSDNPFPIYNDIRNYWSVFKQNIK